MVDRLQYYYSTSICEVIRLHSLVKEPMLHTAEQTLYSFRLPAVCWDLQIQLLTNNTHVTQSELADYSAMHEARTIDGL
jgi:hypothetical protein